MIGPITQARHTLAAHEAERPHVAGRARQAVGGVLVADGLVGLENPWGGRSRPGLLGSFVGVVFAGVFLAVPLLILREVRAEQDVTSPTLDDPFATYVLYAFVAVAALLLLSAALTVVLRLASVLFGVVLLRQGRRMAAAHPASAADERFAAEAREILVGLLARSRAAQRGRSGSAHRHHSHDDGWAGGGSTDGGGSFGGGDSFGDSSNSSAAGD